MVEEFRKDYRVAIDTVPLPEEPAERVQVIWRSITPVINQIVRDAMSAAIGTWPTPEERTTVKEFRKDYWVAIDTVPLPEKPAERVQVISRSITPAINQIVRDAMNAAIGTWPTPEDPRLQRRP